MEVIYAIAALLTIGYLWLSLIATIALIRTDDLVQFQKIIQGIVVVIIPYIGAVFVLRFLKESDEESIPKRWIPNDTINQYVRELLEIEARKINRAVGNEILESFSEGYSSSDSGGGGGN